MATFRKNKQGDWVVLGTVDEVVPGAFCRVTKKNGSRRTVFIFEVGTPFKVEGVSMVYGYIGTTQKESPREGEETQKESPR